MSGKGILLWGLVFLAISLTAHPVSSITWYVTPDGSGEAPTIQAAIDSAATGDTVLVAPGFYSIDEDINIREQQRLYLIGEAGAEETIIDAGGRDVEVKIGGYPVLDEVVLKGLTFQFFQVSAIAANDVTSLVVEESIIRYIGDAGITMGFCTATIRNNMIYSNAYGIFCGFFNHQIVNNTIAYNTVAGILFAQSGGAVYTLSNNLITNNYVGIASYTSAVDCTCNNVYGNSNNYAFYLSDQTGINGNISTSPQYCALNPRQNGNFYLQSDSPCVPGNHPDGESCGLIGALPIGCSTTSVKTTSWSDIKSIYK